MSGRWAGPRAALARIPVDEIGAEYTLGWYSAPYKDRPRGHLALQLDTPAWRRLVARRDIRIPNPALARPRHMAFGHAKLEIVVGWRWRNINWPICGTRTDETHHYGCADKS